MSDPADTMRLRLLEAALEHVGDSIVITDAQLDAPGPHIVYVNQAFCAMTGYAADEVLGCSPRILQGPKTDRAVLDRLRASLEAGEPFAGEAVNYRKDGTPFVLEWNIRPIRDASGTVTHWVSAQRDKTARRLVEEELMSVQVEQRRQVQAEAERLAEALSALRRHAHRLRAYEDAETAETVRTLIDEAQGALQTLGRALRFTRYGGGGLLIALHELAQTVKEQHGVACTFRYEQPLQFEDTAVASTLYMIAQEAVTSALRHADSQHILVALSVQERAVTLTVCHDGAVRSEARSAQSESRHLIERYAEEIGAHLHTRPTADGPLLTVTVQTALPFRERIGV